MTKSVEIRCGGCGSSNVLTTADTSDKTLYAVCVDCNRLQEAETRADPSKQVCSNCAFRKGSPEQEDPWRKAQLNEIVEEGAKFYCHKGEVFDHETGKFTYPDLEDAKVCAGWIATRKAFVHSTIKANVQEALDNALANEYSHEFSRPALEVVNEIHDFSGIEHFDPENPLHTVIATRAVIQWREKNEDQQI